MTVQLIADLRDALRQATAELAFEAGRQVDTDPDRAEHLIGVVQGLNRVLEQGRQEEAGTATDNNPNCCR